MATKTHSHRNALTALSILAGCAMLASAAMMPSTAEAGGWECNMEQLRCNDRCDYDIDCTNRCMQEALACIFDDDSGSGHRSSAQSYSAEEQPLRDWGTWESAMGKIRVCVRDHECEDGDILRVSVDGRSWQEELYNENSCRTYTMRPGRHSIDIYAVNGTGHKGSCSYKDANTGEITVTSYRYGGSGLSADKAATQTWQLRGGAGSSSTINIVVR
jgi:hypothetical protein